MLKLSFAILACFFLSSVYSQTVWKQLAGVKTIADAEKFIAANPSREGKLFIISENRDTSEILLPLFNKPLGYTFSFENAAFKIVDTATFSQYRVSYIYLDGSIEGGIRKIDSLRKDIIQKYRSGTLFSGMVAAYTMDGNPTGDLGWFVDGIMVKEFEDAVKNHRKGDIFTVDVPANNWYYVVLKTFDDRKLRKLMILKVNSDNIR